VTGLQKESVSISLKNEFIQKFKSESLLAQKQNESFMSVRKKENYSSLKRSKFNQSLEEQRSAGNKVTSDLTFAWSEKSLTLNKDLFKSRAFGMRWKNPYQLSPKVAYNSLIYTLTPQENLQRVTEGDGRLGLRPSPKSTPSGGAPSLPVAVFREHGVPPTPFGGRKTKGFSTVPFSPKTGVSPFSPKTGVSPFSPKKATGNSRKILKTSKKNIRNKKNFLNGDLSFFFNRRLFWIPNQFYRIQQNTVQNQFLTKKRPEESFLTSSVHDTKKRYLNQDLKKSTELSPSFHFNMSFLKSSSFFDKGTSGEKPPVFIQINRQGYLKNQLSSMCFPSLLKSSRSKMVITNNSYSRFSYMNMNQSFAFKRNWSFNGFTGNKVTSDLTFIPGTFPPQPKRLENSFVSSDSLLKLYQVPFERRFEKSKSYLSFFTKVPLSSKTREESLLLAKRSEKKAININDSGDRLFPSEKTFPRFKKPEFNSLMVKQKSESLNPRISHLSTFCILMSTYEMKENKTWLSYFKMYDTNKKNESSSFLKPNKQNIQIQNISEYVKTYNILSNSIKKQIKKTNAFYGQKQLSLYLISLNFQQSINPNLTQYEDIFSSIWKNISSVAGTNIATFLPEKKFPGEKKNSFQNVNSFPSKKLSAEGREFFSMSEAIRDVEKKDSSLTNIQLKKGWVYFSAVGVAESDGHLGLRPSPKATPFGGAPSLSGNLSGNLSGTCGETNSLTDLVSYHKKIVYPGQKTSLPLNSSTPLYLECLSINDIFNFESFLGCSPKSSSVAVFSENGESRETKGDGLRSSLPGFTRAKKTTNKKKCIKNLNSRFLFSSNLDSSVEKNDHNILDENGNEIPIFDLKKLKKQNSFFKSYLHLQDLPDHKKATQENLQRKFSSVPLAKKMGLQEMRKKKIQLLKKRKQLKSTFIEPTFSSNSFLVLLIQPVVESMQKNLKELSTYVDDSTLKFKSNFFTKTKKVKNSSSSRRFSSTLINFSFHSLLKKRIFYSHQFNKQKTTSQPLFKHPTSNIKIIPMSIDRKLKSYNSYYKTNTPYYGSFQSYQRPTNLGPFFLTYTRPMGVDYMFKTQNVSLAHKSLSSFDSILFPSLNSNLSSFLNLYVKQKKKIYNESLKESLQAPYSPKTATGRLGLQPASPLVSQQGNFIPSPFSKFSQQEETFGGFSLLPQENLQRVAKGNTSVAVFGEHGAPPFGGRETFGFSTVPFSKKTGEESRLLAKRSEKKENLRCKFSSATGKFASVPTNKTTLQAKQNLNLNHFVRSPLADTFINSIPNLVQSPCFSFSHFFQFKTPPPIFTFENLQRESTFFGQNNISSERSKRLTQKMFKNSLHSSLGTGALGEEKGSIVPRPNKGRCLVSSLSNMSSTVFSYNQRNKLFRGIQLIAKTNIYSPFNGEIVLLNSVKGCIVLTTTDLMSYYLLSTKSSSPVLPVLEENGEQENLQRVAEGAPYGVASGDGLRPSPFQNLSFSPKTSTFSLRSYSKKQKSYPINDILVKFLNMTDVKLDQNLLRQLGRTEENYQKDMDLNANLQNDTLSFLKSSPVFKVSNLIGGQPIDLSLKLRLGDFCFYGDPITEKTAIQTSGQLIHFNNQKITLRRAQPIFISPKGILHKFDNDFVDSKTPVITLSYQKLKTGDIIQGIPKVEQFFEARTTKRGRFFRDSLPYLLKTLFKRYRTKLPLDLAVRQSFYKIQQILVDGVHRVYKSQGVSISDKHLEVIVKQMTSKVRIIDGAQTGFFPGEVVDLYFIEKINSFLMKKITYEPLVLGITKSSLEVDSFLSAASFQQTTRVLSKAALFRKKDFLKGLKENVILGNLIPAGTGFLVYIDL